MEVTAFYRNGIVIKVQTTGCKEDCAFGSWMMSYELRNGQFLRSRYGDHLCPSDRFGEPIPESEVPEDRKRILGQQLNEVRQSNQSFRFIEMK
jgi:hypothetical protein